jgi:hypothetical protein
MIVRDDEPEIQVPVPAVATVAATAPPTIQVPVL